MAKSVQQQNSSIFDATQPDRKLFPQGIDKYKGKIGEFKLDVQPDIPDLRDRMYEPSLIDLKMKLNPPPGIKVRNQGNEGACTGFALAAVVDHLNRIRREGGARNLPSQVSARMLYHIAKLHDEWAGTDYEGSTIRGALKGFFHNGVCSEKSAPYEDGDATWTLNFKQATEAREIGLGAYYRLRPNIVDYHAALNEVGAIYCSAYIHDGWRKPESGKIESSHTYLGGHAFAVVGYDSDGFLILNSWGKDWGKFHRRSGVAHWPYRDWAANVMDAWVLRLAVPTPDAFDIITAPGPGFGAATRQQARTPRRSEIIGHFVNIDDGELIYTGDYATPMDSLDETSEHLEKSAKSPERKYDHILFYAHGGLNSLNDSARRIHAMREVFKRNRIYPIHFMWGTGFSEEFFDALVGAFGKSTERVGGFTDILDTALEKFARPIGRAVWKQMKDDARRSFLPGMGGYQALSLFLNMNSTLDNPYKIHLVGHSAGAIFHGHLLDAIPSMQLQGQPIESVNLMAPACTIDHYESHYESRIGKTGVDGIRNVSIFRLTDALEQRDSVGSLYRKSLLYLVSNAFEEIRGTRLLGMQKNTDRVARRDALKFIDSEYGNQNIGKKCASKSHGGFDNDRATMNHILNIIAGSSWNETLGFQEHELSGF